MPAAEALRVVGLRDLERAFGRADKKLRTSLRDTLKAAAEPVRVDAEGLARSRIRRIGTPWSQMRVGVTSSIVYVAPARRSRKARRNHRLRRPGLAPLLLDRAMEPALLRNREEIERRVTRLLDDTADVWERG